MFSNMHVFDGDDMSCDEAVAALPQKEQVFIVNILSACSNNNRCMKPFRFSISFSL